MRDLVDRSDVYSMFDSQVIDNRWIVEFDSAAHLASASNKRAATVSSRCILCALHSVLTKLSAS